MLLLLKTINSQDKMTKTNKTKTKTSKMRMISSTFIVYSQYYRAVVRLVIKSEN